MKEKMLTVNCGWWTMGEGAGERQRPSSVEGHWTLLRSMIKGRFKAAVHGDTRPPPLRAKPGHSD